MKRLRRLGSSLRKKSTPFISDCQDAAVILDQSGVNRGYMKESSRLWMMRWAFACWRTFGLSP